MAEFYYQNPGGATFKLPDVSTILFDEEEIHHNCTVQILHNSVTGEYSFGWYEEGEFTEEDEI